MIIRKETYKDIDAITGVTVAAFKNLPISHKTEHFIVQALRAAGVLSLSLVAEIDGSIVGHIAFSPVTISDNTTGWYGLGPLSVAPRYHKQGVGSALVNEGLALLKASVGLGCAVVGEPTYYGRFGFQNYPELILEGVHQEVFLNLPFTEKIPRGFVLFHEAFQATE